ncbi:DMT family protein [Teredinibacter turnerae]|uniref:DMT family protein n=1 Tax=Teredinibacter turnerae TaxID=2426 RepID=UPI00048BE8AC|nr:DMT family protein [Teredinibacter turnerae]
MHPIFLSVSLLILSNVFMTFAWYAHLKELNGKHWMIAAFISWGIALFEYLIQVPANRIGYTVLSVGELKIIQEVVTLSVFVPFSLMYLKEPLKLDYLWAGLCLLGAVFFMFRSKLT